MPKPSQVVVDDFSQLKADLEADVVRQPVTGGRKPTPEQQAIIEAVQEDFDVLVVEAGAGTGKTTTLRMIADVLPGNGQYTAFNTKLVDDSKEKFVGTRVAANTTHSLAFRAVGRHYKHRLDGYRVRNEAIAKSLGIESFDAVLSPEEKETDDNGNVIVHKAMVKTLRAGLVAAQVIKAVQRFAQSDDRVIGEQHFAYLDGIDLPKDGKRTYANNKRLKSYLLPFAQKYWADMISPEGGLPFSHDIYVKIWQLQGATIAADYILLDEAQDTAPVMLDVLKQQLGKAKIIFVGDSAQQIYEWRGAVNALAAFEDAPRQLLSQSFRFGPAIAEVANSILSDLDEPTALRLKGLESIPSKLAVVNQPTAIITRTNAAAVSHLLNEIANGRKPHLIGGGKEVISFVESAEKLQKGQKASHGDLICFDSWQEVQQYVADGEGDDLKLLVDLIDSFGTDIILQALKTMPAEEYADVVITTAHKSKGREWDHVVIASDFPTKESYDEDGNLKRVSTDSDKRLIYVACTRAKLTLDITGCPYFTGVPCGKAKAADIQSLISRAKAQLAKQRNQPAPVAHEAPGNAPAASGPAPDKFTWSKGKDGSWNVRGPAGYAGKSVSVVRANGSSSQKTLGSVIWTDNAVALYRVG